MYKKRQGTSRIRGQLYETKLISLLLYRARHSDQIEEIHLASNVDKIGAFDDICFRVKFKGLDRPLIVFIQGKHRENDKALSFNNKADLIKYFISYLKIRREFESNNEDVLFHGKFDENECLFVLYTTTKSEDDKKLFENKFSRCLNDLICTSGAEGFHPSYNDEDVKFLCKLALKEQITSLAVLLAKFIYDEDNYNYQTLLNNELVLKYHVILANKVMIISNIHPEGYRIATFREDFFYTNEEFITSFKETLFIEVLKKRKVDHEEKLLSELFSTETPSFYLLSTLIGSVVTYNKYAKLEFINKNRAEDLKQQLYKVHVSQVTVDEAINFAAKNILSSRLLKVPAAFGNRDLKIRGNDVNIEKRLKSLASKICDLLEKSQADNKVVLDKSLGKGFLQLNGGIASAVGNILVPDENNELMKFTDNCESLENLAKRLYEKIKLKIYDLHKYKFEVKLNDFPKHSFVCNEYELSLVQDFLNKRLLYTNQGDENRVGEILKNKIEEHQCNTGDNFRVRSDAILLAYHDEIQKWWMLSSEANYLNKETKNLDKSIRNIIKEPLMSTVNVISRNKIKNINYTFNEDALMSLNYQDPCTIITTDIVALTVVKVLQSLKNKDHVILDLEYLLNLPIHDCNELCAELTNTSKNKILIFVCENVHNSRNPFKTLEKIATSVDDKIKILITNQVSVDILKKYFPPTSDQVTDKKLNLTTMSDESRKSILKNATVIFQDEKVSLDLIVDDVSMAFVEGDILNRIIKKETIEVGKSLGNPNFDEIKHLYVHRRVKRGGQPRDHENKSSKKDSGKVIVTLYDITDNVVLITAKPGMGKSTLLTHVSLETKKLDPRVWIIRINLLDYAKEFSMWQKNKTVIDTLESLNFICRAALGREYEKINKFTVLEESNGTIKENDCISDQWMVFQVNIFLHFYNTVRMIFLFDGFDEICPHYSLEVVKFLKTVRNFPRSHKMWIASRSYNKIKSILQREFGVSYEIEHFSFNEKEKYLEKFWKSNLVLNELDGEQLGNVYNFMEFMRETLNPIEDDFSSTNKLQNLPLHEIYFNAMDYFKYEIRNTDIHRPECIELRQYFTTWTLINGLYSDKYSEILAEYIRYNGHSDEIVNMFKFIATPLHLYLIADYFQNEIKDVSKKIDKWNLDINTVSIYERFLETKLKIIRFQEKNKMDIYNPDVMITYEKERIDFITKHKIMAAYAIFHRMNHTLFSRKELKIIKNTIKLIKKGGEKTGLIFSVAFNKIPIFIHMTFAEYFAVEYFCDLLKIEKCSEKLKSMLDFLFNKMFFESPANVRNILDSKLVMDDALMNVLKNNGKVIFDVMIEQTKGYPAYGITDIRDEFFEIQYSFCLNLAVRDNLSNFVDFFISLLEIYLIKDNLDYFTKIIMETSMLITAVRVEYHKFILFILDIVRKIDESKIKNLFSIKNISPFVDLSLKSDEELLEILYVIAKYTSYTTTPYYMYSASQDTHEFILV